MHPTSITSCIHCPQGPRPALGRPGGRPDAHRNPSKESYTADAALFDLQTQKVWLAVGAALLVLFPFIPARLLAVPGLPGQHQCGQQRGLNILTGYTGLVSMGQAAFMGLGAYTVAIMQARWGTTFLLNILRRRGGHAGRHCGGHSVAARQGAVPGHW